MVSAFFRDTEINPRILGMLVALIAVLGCGGALYYFLVLGMKPGNVTVVAIPADVKVFLDGKEQPGNGTPHTIRSLKPGPYIVSVFKTGYKRWTKTVEVKPGGTNVFRPSSRRWPRLPSS